jgi:CRP-like cAMP-binding protein
LRDSIREILNNPAFLEGIAWKQRYFHANEIIIRAGEMSKSLFLIEEGKFRVTVQVELEKLKKLRPGICELQAGDIFGETALLESAIRTASVIAITDGYTVEIDADKLSVYLDENPVQGYFFFKKLFVIMVERLHRGNHRIETLLAWGLKAHDIEKHL